jgi:type 1 glutamine amidotransferase
MTMRRIAGYGLLALLVVAGLFAYQNRLYLRLAIQQPQLFQAPVLDQSAPALPSDLGAVPILSFSKTNGYRHHDSIAASIKMLDELGSDNGWQFFHTENGAVFTPENLQRFRLIVLNHKSGTVWTKEQRRALKNFVQEGGTLLAQHAAGGDQGYDWPWYLEQVLRAQFVQHIQPATLIVEDRSHPATAHLGLVWQRRDEWYNFAASPRGNTQVLVSIDEATYDPEKSPMGADHPVVWWHRVGKGRVFYSALGHTSESYSERDFRAFIQGAIIWGLDTPKTNESEE